MSLRGHYELTLRRKRILESRELESFNETSSPNSMHCSTAAEHLIVKKVLNFVLDYFLMKIQVFYFLNALEV